MRRYPRAVSHKPTSLLTPAMAGLLDRIRRARLPPFHTMTAVQARAAYEAAAEVLDLLVPEVKPGVTTAQLDRLAHRGTPWPIL